MNILIVGAGKGSWVMRGQQLGAALGARVTSSPTDADFTWCDLVVLVKKHAVHFAPRAHKAGKPIVWDALDFWSQPAQNSYTRDAALLALRSHAKIIQPALIIGATEAMAADAASLGFKSAYLPHHSWAGLQPTPPRANVSVVAYEGNPSYLGRWLQVLRDACALRGWSFKVNPPNLADVDILVAFRDGSWDGWICREWKSGVKVVNAIAAGRPIIMQGCAAWRELGGFFVTIEHPEAGGLTLGQVLDHWSNVEHREAPYRAALEDAPKYTLAAVADRYRSILATAGAPCSV